MGIVICSPRADRFSPPEAVPSGGEPTGLVPISLDGTVAVVDNGKFGIVGDALERVLLQRGAAEVVRVRPGYPRLTTADFLDELAPRLSGAIAGLGACGSCTAWSCHATAELQRRGVGARVFVLDAFEAWARSAVTSYGGHVDAVVAAGPGLDWQTGDELDAGVGDVLDRMVSLTAVAS